MLRFSICKPHKINTCKPHFGMGKGFIPYHHKWGLLYYRAIIARKDIFMNNEKMSMAAVTTKEDKPDLVKIIGKTTYRVKVHFNPQARETMQDKIVRMLRNEVSQM